MARRKKASRTPWSTADIRELKRRYPDERAADIADDLGRPLESIYTKASALGLKKSDEFYASDQSGRTNGSHGGSTRFKKGLTPWNKGTNFTAGGRSAETRFTKGTRPHTWVPIGTEVVTDDGYIKRKIRDDAPPGMSRNNWKFLHIIAWEEANGPIPKGYMLRFRNDNRQDVRIENLELLSRKENARRNTIHRYPQEIVDVIRLKGRVTRQINKRSQTNEKQD